MTLPNPPTIEYLDLTPPTENADLANYLARNFEILQKVLGQFASAENGFVSRADSTVSFVDGTRTFTIAPVSGSYDIVQASAPYTIEAAKSIQIADTEGLHYIYFEGDQLYVTTTFTPDIISLYAFIAVIYWDATNSTAILFGEERHGNIMDSATHSYNHLTFRARFQSGLQLGDMNVDASGNLDTSAQFSVADGFIWDEDIQHSIIDGSPQDLSTIAQIPLFYMTGASADWRMIAATDFPVTTTGSGRAAYNLDTAGTWSLAEVSNNDFVVYHYFATNDLNHPVIGVVGQNIYLTQNAARLGAEVELDELYLQTLDTLVPEFVAVASVIWQTSSSYTNTVESRIRLTDTGDDYVDWRKRFRGGT